MSQLKKPQTAYFLFMGEQRKLLAQEINTDAEKENKKLSVGEIAKIIGQKWKDMDASEKEKYNELARKDKERYAKEVAQMKEDGTYPDEVEKKSAISNLPLARVKRLVKSDPEVKNVSKDALLIITKAAEEFIKTLGEKTHHISVENNRKGIRDTDLEILVHRNEIFNFLRNDFPLSEGIDLYPPISKKQKMKSKVKKVSVKGLKKDDRYFQESH